MAEQFTGPRILYLKPAWGKTDHRNHKFPAVLIVSWHVFLAMNRVCGSYRLAIVYIDDVVVKNIYYVIVSSAINVSFLRKNPLN